MGELAWWRVLRACADVNVSAVAENRELVEALLQLVGAADEACVGVGITGGGVADYFDVEASTWLTANW